MIILFYKLIRPLIALIRSKSRLIKNELLNGRHEFGGFLFKEYLLVERIKTAAVCAICLVLAL